MSGENLMTVIAQQTMEAFEISFREGIEYLQREGLTVVKDATVRYWLKRANEGEPLERAGAILVLMQMGIVVEIRVKESHDGVVD
jgi:hypothetical protein